MQDSASAAFIREAFFPKLPPEWPEHETSAIAAWIDRQRQRAALAELDDRLLADIGITRTEARLEAARWN